jgi:octopine/nopaline transport system substrate-binding protein
VTRSIIFAGATALALTAGAASAQDVVRIGTEGAYAPWNFTNEAGELVGFEIDLGNAICELNGWECEWVAQDWDGIIPALQQGRYDAIMAGMSITDQRDEVIDFSIPYMTTPARFATADAELADELADADAEAVFAALEGGVVGVQTGTIHQNLVEQEVAGADLRFYDTQDQLNLDVQAGRVDAGLADINAWLDFNAAEGSEEISLIGPGLTGADFPVLGAGVGVGLREADDDLQAAFNEAICTLYNDGTITDMTIEWFGFDATVPCDL